MKGGGGGVPWRGKRQREGTEGDTQAVALGDTWGSVSFQPPSHPGGCALRGSSAPPVTKREKAVSVAGQAGRLNDSTLKGNEESPAEHGDSRRTAGLARLARLALAERRAQPGCGTGG